EAEYEWPFQSHACMGPACAMVEVKDGDVTCWTGSQKPHFVRNGIALSLGVPAEKVRSIWVVGPGSYGRSDADDAAMDAAVLANAVGKPVRVQYTREQATGWDPKGPASIHRARAAIEFRLRHVKDARDVAVIKAAAEKAGWQSRPSPRKDQSGNKVSGRGIAYSQRNGTRCAIVAEVDIDRASGKIWARKFTVAH